MPAAAPGWSKWSASTSRKRRSKSGQGLGLTPSSAAAAIVVLLWQPTRRPSGLPDRPFSNGRPRTRPGGFRISPSVIVISSVLATGGPSRNRFRPEYMHAN
jgi:hypothetical protein